MFVGVTTTFESVQEMNGNDIGHRSGPSQALVRVLSDDQSGGGS
jgi:hypothetical protein